MKFIFTFLFIMFSISGYGQNIQVQSVNVELGKNGLLANIIYDYKFSKTHFGFRAGAGTNFSKYLQARTVTLGVYKLMGHSHRFFELGADFQYLYVSEVSDDQKGFAFVYPDFSTKTNYTSLNIGYRKYYKKTVFRAGVSPGFTKHGFLPGAYLSFGFSW